MTRTGDRISKCRRCRGDVAAQSSVELRILTMNSSRQGTAADVDEVVLPPLQLLVRSRLYSVHLTCRTPANYFISLLTKLCSLPNNNIIPRTISYATNKSSPGRGESVTHTQGIGPSGWERIERARWLLNAEHSSHWSLHNPPQYCF
jgi:hypothetical protein